MLFELFQRKPRKGHTQKTPKNLAELVQSKLEKKKVEGPPGMPEFMVRMRIAATAVGHEVVRAYAAGVRPSYEAWLLMPDDEREAWELVAAEHEKAQLAIKALVAGNVGVARRALHDGDIEAIRQDAIVEGLQACGIL